MRDKHQIDWVAFGSSIAVILLVCIPLAMFPETTMMARPIPDSQDRADLIAYLIEASQRD